MSTNMSLDVMTEIQEQKAAEIAAGDPRELDPEETAMAEDKRKTFDLPTNAVKVDPLR